MPKEKQLSPRQKHLLKQFVNREDELHKFCKLLDADEQIVMIVTGDPDIGKTSFMAKMISECRELNWLYAVVSCDRMTNVDYRSVMRKLRDEIGKEHFESFSKAENELGEPKFKLQIESTSSGDISVAESATIEDSAAVGDIVGVQIKGLNVSFSKEYLDQFEKERKSKLTEEFVDNLASVAQQDRLVIFFDAVENMPVDTENWVTSELIMATLDGKVPNVKFVECGQAKPESIDSVEKWSVKESRLKPLEEQDIVEYLKKRGIEDEQPEETARLLAEKTQGVAGRVAEFVDAYEEQIGVTG